MPILREVITRFSFETDKKGVQNFERTMRRMTRGTKKLARLFGITLGAAGVLAMGKLGLSIERARFNMERFTGLNTQQLTKQLANVRGNLDAIKKGFGAKVTERNFFVAGSEFFKTFGKGEQQMAAFRQTFEAAAKLSLATGRNVNELFSSITAGIKSGDLGFLGDLGVTEVQIQNLQDRLSAIDPGAAFTSAVGMGQRMNTVLGLLRARSGQINKELGQIPIDVLDADKAASKMQQTMDSLGRTLTKSMVPALQKLNQLLDKMVITSKKAEKIGIFGAFIEEPATKAAKAAGVPQGVMDVSRGVSTLGKRAISMIFQQTNHIKSTDPKLAADESAKATQKMLRDAQRELVPTEDR